MSYACVPILVGVVSLVSEILILSKTAKFPFQTMDYSPWSSKNLINRNRLRKFMQIDIDVTCMYTEFWWAWSLRFRRYWLLSKTAKFPFRTMGYSPWSSKNLIVSESAQKIHASRSIDVTCMSHQFWWAWSLRFRRYYYSQKTAKFPFRTMGYSPWSSKNLINQNRLKKFMQVDIDATCMYTNFGGRGLCGFGDIATLKNGQISLSDHGL